MRVELGAEPHGLPLVGFALVDRFGAQLWQPSGPLMSLPGLPLAGIEVGGVSSLVHLATASGATLDVVGSVDLVRHLLLTAATPMEDYGPHEVGAGFIDEERMVTRLAAVSGLDVLAWFSGTDTSRLPEHTRGLLAGQRVFDADGLRGLAQLLRATGPVLAVDIDSLRFGLGPLLDEELATLPFDHRLLGVEIPSRAVARSTPPGGAG